MAQVKMYHSRMLEAPTLNGLSGSLITVLDAILVSGFGQVNVTSINRSGSTATMVTATAHGFETGTVVQIAGAAETEYNGEFVVQAVDGTTVTFAVSGTPATPATGTITVKRAPAGFSKAFADGSTRAAYRSNDMSSRRNFLYVNDASVLAGGSKEAQVFAYESMSDIDTGTNRYPESLVFICVKSGAVSAEGRNWIAVSDGKTLYFFTHVNSASSGGFESPGTNGHSGLCFGDLIAYKPDDVNANFVTGSSQSSAGNSTTTANGIITSTTSLGSSATLTAGSPVLCMLKDFTGVGGSVAAAVYGVGQNYVGQNVFLGYPHLPDNGFYMVPLLATQSGPSLIRGRLPGLYESVHGRCFANGAVIENVQGFAGRKFIMVYSNAGSSPGCVVIDTTGPWDS